MFTFSLSRITTNLSTANALPTASIGRRYWSLKRWRMS